MTSEMQLGLRQWAVVAALVAVVLLATPRLWKRIERFDTAADYRVPYQLSNDYWLFDWRLQKAADAKSIVVLGDSVVWGEYVKSTGTLPHFLNRQAGQADRFVNAGVNGLYPLAMEGLVRYYGTSLRNRKVIVVCNLLWLHSPEADMQAKKVENVNHAPLLPQFSPRVPAYRADVNERLGAVVGRNVGFLDWVNHLQDCYFGQQSVLQWTLREDLDSPGRYPNSYKNPLSQITLRVPSGKTTRAGAAREARGIGPGPPTAAGRRRSNGSTWLRRCSGPRFSGPSSSSAAAATTCWWLFRPSTCT